MLKICLFKRLWASLILLGIVLVIERSLCEKSPPTLDHELDNLFPDKELKDAISKYLDKVPSSHKSRAQAARFGINFDSSLSLGRSLKLSTKGDTNFKLPLIGRFAFGRSGHSSPEPFRSTHQEAHDKADDKAKRRPKAGDAIPEQGKKAHSYDNKIKDVLNIVISSATEADAGEYCDNKCDPCPPKPSCAPCRKPDCQKCPPCPMPSNICPPPRPNEKCPPEPICDKCESSKATTSTTKKPSSSTTKRASKTTTTKKPSSSTTKTASKSTTTKKPSSSTTKTASKSTTTKKPSSSTTKTASKSTTTKKASSSTTTMGTTTTKKPTTTTKKQSKTTTSTTVTKTPKPTTKVGRITASTTNNPEKPMRREDVSLQKTVSTFTNTTTKTDKDGSVSKIEQTMTTTNITGSYQFDKIVHRLIKNDTLRDLFIKMVDGIPESAGGEEMDLANKILARLDGKQPPQAFKKGSARAFAYNTARNNARQVITIILDRFSRRKCSCPQCEVAPPCKCPFFPTCPPISKAQCPPCEKSMPPKCPAPPGCKEYPPCKKCEQASKLNPDDDGDDPSLLDDVDDVDPVKEGELKKEVKCTGYTCPFVKECGLANLNPLTPKSKQSGYMVGGTDEVYGEWPHYVRIDINVPAIKFAGLCGGVLISDRHVLTAGHCVVRPYTGPNNMVQIEPQEFTVYLADHDRYKTDKFELTRKVSRVCRSTKFNDPNSDGSRYDFGILTLSEKVKFNDHIQPACLPYKPLPEKVKCYVIGLGITKYSKNGSSFAQFIQKMPLVRTTCKNWGIKHDDRSRHCFTKANAPGDTCGGDSGGPVVCLSESKRWTLSGLVSYGSQNCDGTESVGWVGVYTRIPALLKQMQMDCKI